MKDKFVRIGTLTLAFIMILSSFTGCLPKRPGGTSTAPTATSTSIDDLPGELSGTLTVWLGETVDFTPAITKFEEDTGMKVEVIRYSGLTAADKLALDGPAGNGGDVYFQGGGGGLSDAVNQGLFLEVPDGLIDWSLLEESFLQDFRCDGKLYGIPLGGETTALIYNKALLKEIPDTWEELVEECGKYADIAENKYGLLFDATHPYYTNALIAASGGYVFNFKDGVYDTNDIGLNNDATKELYKTFKSYYDKGYLQKNTTFTVMEKKFSEGCAPAIYDGPWAIASYKEAGIDIGVAPLPKMANGNIPKPYSGDFGVAVSAYTKNQKAAFEFLKYCMIEENVMKYCNDTNRIPSLKSCYDRPEIKDDPIRNGFAQQMVNSVPQPNVPEMAQVWFPMINAGSLIFSKGEDISKTLDDAVKLIKEQIALMKS